MSVRNSACSCQRRLPRLLILQTPILGVVKPQYAVRCLSELLIGLLLEDKPQYGGSPRVPGLIAERVYRFPPHLGALVAASRYHCEELDEVHFERRGLAPHAAKRVYGESTYPWNRVMKRHSPQIVGAVVIRVVIEEVYAAPPYRRFRMPQSFHGRR